MIAELSLADWLARLEGLHPKDIDMGLERVGQVAGRLGVLKPAPRVFTVTGTNGKGSTCATLGNLLQCAGLRTGVYSSPHLLHYNERVVINGQQASDAELCEAFCAVEAARDDISLTYFEFGTLAALWLFQRAGLDAVVLEVGLGGRLDAVNVVDADVAVVTSIGLDHQEFLGNSRESVAFEKAGIMRAGRPVVCGETDLPDTFIAEVQRLDARLLQRDQDYHWSALEQGAWCMQGLDAKGLQRRVELPAVSLPRDNLAGALQAFWAAGLDLPDPQLAQALRKAHVPGRLDRRRVLWHGQWRELCLDVGHNPQASGFLASELSRQPRPRVAVFGLLADKDMQGVVEPLLGEFSQWLTAPLPSPRSCSAIVLAQVLAGHGAEASACNSVAEAIIALLEQTPIDCEIVIFGSFFCVAEAILWLSEQTQEPIDG